MLKDGLRNLINQIAVFGIAAVVGSVFLAWYLTRSITDPIRKAVDEITDGAEQVSAAAVQVSSSSQILAEGSSEQAASLEETSSSMEEMASMTRNNADNANQAKSIVKESNEMVRQASESMERLIKAMDDISKASEDTSKIIKTIDEIAFQTNLLALNAAVEAARAGEAGAGFAVVADEVRSLAMRAADAAKNTAQLIEGTVLKVKDGRALLDTTNGAFSGVADSSVKVGQLINEIAAASNEQAQGIEQVNRATTEMDRVVQQSAAGAEESASNSEELAAQAAAMKETVMQLAVLVDGINATQTGRSNNIQAKEKPRAAKVKQLPLAASKKAEKRHLGAFPSGKKLVAQGGGVNVEIDPENVIPMDDEDFKDF